MFKAIFKELGFHLYLKTKFKCQTCLAPEFILAKLANVVYLYFNFLGGIR